jgi:hypothetical protein
VSQDVTIAGASGPAPQSYEVPNSTEIIPRVVRATFDGTLAASAFFPTVQIISDGGVVVGEVTTDTAVSAGGSASVTFAPFLRAAAAGGGGITSITSADGSIVVTNPGGPVTDLAGFKGQTTYEFLSSNTMTLANGAAGTFTWTHANGSSLLDLTLSSAPLVKTAGMWAAVASTRVTANFTAGGYAGVSMGMGDGGVSNQTGNMFLPNAGPTASEFYTLTMVHYMSSTARISLSVFNNDGAANRTFGAQMYVVRIT